MTRPGMRAAVPGRDGAGAAEVARSAAAPYPLTPLQHGMLFQTLLAPASGVNVEQAVCELREAVDAERLERAWRRVVARHDVFRTRFRWADSAEPVQEVLDAVGLELARHDHADLGAAERDAHLQRWLAEDRARGFDLAAAPAMRLALFRHAADEHVLVWSFHHLLIDGRSIADALREAFTLYDAEMDRTEADLPVRRPFRDHVAWLRGRDPAADEAFWSAYLRGLDAPAPVPTLRSALRDAAVEPHFGVRAVQLSPEADAALRAFKRERGINLNTLAQGAWALLLGRYTGAEEAVFGLVRGGRATGVDGADGMMGLLINTVPVRVPLPADARVLPWLREIGERNAALRPHEHAALPDVRRWSGLPSGASLFDTILDYQTQPFEAAFRHLGGRWTGRRFRMLRHPGQALSVAVCGEAPLEVQIEYDADRFDAAAVDRILGHFTRLLAQMAADPDRPLAALDPLDEAERRLVVEEWNRTAAEFPADRCLHHLFEAQAARTPDATAVVHEDGSLTYRELNERANRLAHRLIALGIGPESRVGICAERSPALMIGILAVLKAGGAYIPLDPEYPAERLAYLAKDSGISLVLAQERLRGRLPSEGIDIVALEDDFSGESSTDPSVAIDPRGLAYVIYTSGSTGAPKGVAVEHRSVVSFTADFAARMDVRPSDRVLQLASPAFDIMVEEVFPAWSRGAAVVLPPHGLLAPGDLLSVVERHGVTWMDLPTAYWHEWVLHLARTRERIPAFLRFVVVGGERGSRERLAEWARTGLPLVHMYGVTEATVDSTAFGLESGDDGARWPSLPIGRPTGNARTYVLDAAMRPVPVGAPGELYIGGAGVARGYLGRPGLTAERFVPDPFSGDRGARLYRTGDRVRWLATGDLEFLGRIDHQVKVRGFRIEPGEIEAVLRRHPGVRDAAVVAREDESGERRLVAYVAGAADAEALRAHLRRTLPEHMVPAAFVALDALPLTPNGKLDRGALPAPELGADEDGYVAPRTPVEEVLAGIWAEVLRLERVSVRASFIELGGHSLLATRVISRISAAFGVEMTVRALFESPSVAELAERVEALRRADLPQLPPIVPVERTRPLPLSFAQERLWFLSRLRPDSAFYNIPIALRLRGSLDARALERALGEIVRRHEALRTTFVEAGGSPVQVIAPFAGFALPVEDLSDLDDVAREAAVQRRAEDEAARPFDLSAGPLFRPALLRLGDADHVLLFCMHHIASDEWSTGVLFRELAALYDAYRAGDESPLPDLPVQYADYAVWQREQLRGEALDRQLAWWKERLAGAPALLELPTDHPRPAVQTHRGARERFDLPAELLDRLQALARGEGATLFMVMLGAFQVLLSKYSGSEDVVVGSPIAGRTRPEVEELIGFFVNTLALRTELGGDPSFREVLRRVREATLGAYEHQDLPFERLVEELQPDRTLSHSPLFQVVFTLEDAGRSEAALPGIELQRLGADSGTSKFDLTLFASTHAGGISGVLEYSTDLFERATIARMAGHLARVLEQVAGDADLPLSSLELLGQDERALVIDSWNRTETEYPADRCIHELFEAQAARTPDAVAVICGRDSLTYRGLNERANRLAHHLVRLGVGPEVRVGICLHRGIDLLVSALAVLKAGGAYLPLDPSYPAARLELTLRDADAAVLLTHGGLAPRVRNGVRVVRVDADRHAIASESAANLASGAAPRNLAYVIYTSGSTGTPKGVAVEHAALGSLCAWHARAFGVTPTDRATLLASPGFDASVWEVWPYLTRGASVEVVPEQVRSDPAGLRDWLVEHAVTLSFIPTPVAEPMLALQWPRETPLRWLLIGGDRLRARPVADLPFVLSNNYGPTECTVVATSGPVAAEGERAPSIGGPIDNTRIYVLDGAMRPLPAGVPGELYIGGAQVARGYLGRPRLTAERFLPDPFAAQPGARMYRTGDKVRWLADGTVEYLGRLDEQVKIRGFRIELGEIESTLRRHDGVRDCAVIAREDAAGEKRLAAYVVGDVESDELRSHLRRNLPDYMVPATFVFLDALPLTPNGKLDRRALPAPQYGSAEDHYVAPRTPVEEALAGIWAEVLRLERVGVRENFFSLGGHSLLATRVVARIREVLDGEIHVVSLFENPTIDDLARHLSEKRSAAPAARAQEIGAASSPHRLLAAIDELSEEELDRLLGVNPENRTFE